MKPFYRAILPTGITVCIVLLSFLPDIHAADEPLRLPFSRGETVIYDIRKFKLPFGEASLVFDGPAEVGGEQALSITFTAKGFNFLDEERIYLDPKTFHPLVIRRNLNIFGVKEQITEFYDSQRGKVRIVKTAKGKTSEEIIENGKRFDNIYGFIYRYRQMGRFQKGEEFRLHLPTRDVHFKLIGKKELKTAGRTFDAHVMKSTPKKYKVLFDSGFRKIPLMINGALGVGSASMVMKEYRQ